MVVGNKIDLAGTVKRDLAQLFARKIGAPYFETSALTRQGLPELFQSLAVLAAG